jgi:dolichyl-phosphate-mannose--protein O-mannosyl transferase
VAFAAGTVAFVGVLARRLYGPGLALAAAFIAVDVVHVRQASLVSVDASLACWCVAVVWAAVRLLQNEAVRDYGRAGPNTRAR